MGPRLKRATALLVGVGLWAGGAGAATAAEAAGAKGLEVRVVPQRPVSPQGDPLAFDVTVRNAGPAAVNVFRSLEPEGWLVLLTVKGAGGAVVYESHVVKLEATAAALELVRLGPNDLHGHRFQISKINTGPQADSVFPPGEYTVSARLTIRRRGADPAVEVANGTWMSDEARVTVAAQGSKSTGGGKR